MSARGFIAAGIVGIGAWAIAQYANQRRGQMAYLERTTITPGKGDLASLLSDGLFDIFDALQSGDSASAQTTGRGMLDGIFADLPTFNTGSAHTPFALPASLTTPRERVQVPSTVQQAAPASGLSRERGSANFGGVTVVYAMGPSRPFRPGFPVVMLSARAVAQTFGAGSKMTITSGQEGHLPQYGSNRHKTGQAVDFYVNRPNGARVQVAELDELARNLARLGALGIGWGPEYMGSSIHVDTLTPGPGQAHTWASRGRAMRTELMRLMGVA
jgi:hypothetical protein